VIISEKAWPAYHFIPSTDLTTMTLPRADIPTASITSTAMLSGFISLTPLVANQPITKGQVIPINDTTAITDKVVIAVEGGPALVFGGQLQPGTIVSAWAGKDLIAKNILVLDVRQFEVGETPEVRPRYVVILAISPDMQDKVLLAATKGTLLFAANL
jgi:Flp pilus assembly protein CpaB